MIQKESDQNPNIEITYLPNYVKIEYRDIIDFGNQMRLIDVIHGIYLKKNHSKFVVNTKGCPIKYSVFERHQVAIYLAEKFQDNIALACIIDKDNLTGISENTSQNRGASGFKIVTEEIDAIHWIESIARPK